MLTQSLYERERYEEVLHVASEIHVYISESSDSAEKVSEWMKSVGEGVLVMVLSKVAIGAVVGNDNDEILSNTASRFRCMALSNRLC